MLKLEEANLIGWGLALAGCICAVVAAYLQGGGVAAWTAAAVGLNGLAGAWGYSSKGQPR